MDLRFVALESSAWHEARELRYSAFYLPLGLPRSVLDDAEEQQGHHLVAVDNDRVVACARLTNNGNGKFSLSQMVVAPEQQRNGLGRTIMKFLISQVLIVGGHLIELDARITAVGFYAKLDFQQEGPVFLSKRTGIPHIHMTMRLGNFHPGQHH